MLRVLKSKKHLRETSKHRFSLIHLSADPLAESLFRQCFCLFKSLAAQALSKGQASAQAASTNEALETKIDPTRREPEPLLAKYTPQNETQEGGRSPRTKVWISTCWARFVLSQRLHSDSLPSPARGPWATEPCRQNEQKPDLPDEARDGPTSVPIPVQPVQNRDRTTPSKNMRLLGYSMFMSLNGV